MACGKSTIGRKLQKSLSLPLYDTDKVIVEREGMSVAEIFDKRGEEYFRHVESDVINNLISNNISAVVSTGGGAPMWGDNMAKMNNAGLTVYLSRTAENICSRISLFGREKRPKLRGLNDAELLSFMQQGVAQRDERYREANFVIECDHCSDEIIIAAIISHINAQKG